MSAEEGIQDGDIPIEESPYLIRVGGKDLQVLEEDNSGG